MVNVNELLKPISSAELYDKAKEADLIVGNHASDLYIRVTEESRQWINRYEWKKSVTTFIDNIDKQACYDVPFAHQPYWDAVEAKTRRKRNIEKAEQVKADADRPGA